MNLVYDPLRDGPANGGGVDPDAAYKALRAALYQLLAGYTQADAVRALTKTAREWTTAP